MSKIYATLTCRGLVTNPTEVLTVDLIRMINIRHPYMKTVFDRYRFRYVREYDKYVLLIIYQWFNKSYISCSK